MISPTREEDDLVETHLGIEIPTREEMADIEPSEILYRENNALYMTARVLCSSDTETPQLLDVSFILTDKALVTVRYGEPRSFAMFMSRVIKPGGCRHQPEAVLDGLIETIIDRAAEILASVGKRIDYVSREIFETERKKARQTQVFRAALRSIGRKGRRDLERAREHGVGGADAAVPLGRDAAPAAGARLSGRVAHGLARRAIDRGTCDVPVEQGAVSSRRDARSRDHRAERHHQAVLGDVGDFSAAHPAGLDLRHELSDHARASVGAWLSVRHPVDGRSPRCCLT